MTTQSTCDRCGIAASDTQEGFLAFNGSRRVCADCDSDLTAEWCAEDASRIHPLDTFCPAAHVRARLAA